MSIREAFASAGSLWEQQPGLLRTIVCADEQPAVLRVDGVIRLDHEHNEVRLVADYDVSATISEGFPTDVPQLIVRNPDPSGFYPHAYEDGRLCLGVDGEMSLILARADNPSEAFFEEIVMPNLYAVEFFRRYRTMPFDDRSHGEVGVLEFYRELFNMDRDRAVLELLRIAAGKEGFRRRNRCPCGSGRQLGSCHAGAVEALRYNVGKNVLLSDCGIATSALGLTKALGAKDATRARLKEHRTHP
ncbi:MAG: SEC-C domain-containing protein [Atopobiaceae bacterium]|nr:SEC-C domain-containing protein [Atopobiaceae bacterium]